MSGKTYLKHLKLPDHPKTLFLLGIIRNNGEVYLFKLPAQESMDEDLEQRFLEEMSHASPD